MASTQGQDFSKAIVRWKREKKIHLEKKRNKHPSKSKQVLLSDDKELELGPPKKNKKSERPKEPRSDGSTWRDIWAKSRLLWPFLWPRGSYALQAKVVVCVVILIAIRGITVLIPLFKKKIVDSLTVQYADAVSDSDRSPSNDTDAVTVATLVKMATTVRVHGIEFRWDFILLFIMVKALKGCYLETLRSFLWIRVSQNTRKSMRLALFGHLHSLSLQWHLSRKTGEVLKVVNRGVGSIDVVLSHVLFNVFPAIADIIIGIVFFVTAFNLYIGLIVFACMAIYLVGTILLTEWRTTFRRRLNDADNERGTVNVDSILNFETVKYYASEDWEAERYSEALDKHVQEEWLFSAVTSLQTCLQRTVMELGLLGGCLLTAWYIYQGQLTVGDYVLFTSYLEQLFGPLATFGNQYRIIQKAFVDMENMLDLMGEEIDVTDNPDAQPLKVKDAGIEFNDVSFSYIPGKQVLTNVSFHIPPGKTYALVGHSGSGKSTILRLLLRFYNLEQGQISIDNTPIDQVTQKSLRQQIGVVPQDTVLFNNSIRYNIRYGRVRASDPEVEEAAKVADIHNRILLMPEGYESRVGERGLKLSGGEKQRVAIARTILKNPRIVLLDEATSALDTKTERNIQSSLARMCENRTTVIVAHRLSTIVHADKILVMDEGRIVEQGSHGELLSAAGLYADMWFEQLREQAEDESESTSSENSKNSTAQEDPISSDRASCTGKLPIDPNGTWENTTTESSEEITQSTRDNETDKVTTPVYHDDDIPVVMVTDEANIICDQPESRSINLTDLPV